MTNGQHQSLKPGPHNVPFALERDRMGVGYRNKTTDLADKTEQTKSFQQQYELNGSQNNQQVSQQITPGSSYSKSRKKKGLIKDKALNIGLGEPAAISNAAPSCQSKEVYEGGTNDKHHKNAYLVSGANSAQKTPKHHNSSGLVLANESGLTGFPQFI